MKTLFFLLISIASYAQTVLRMGTATGINQYDVSFNPPITAFNQNTIYTITFTNANTAALVTLDPAGVVDPTPIRDNSGNVLPVGALKAGGMYNLRFDGTVLRATNITTATTDNDVTYMVKTSNYSPIETDGQVSNPAFLMRSVGDIALTIPSYSTVNFPQGQQFKIKNDSTGVLSILRGNGVDFKSITPGPWTLEEDEYAVATKINTTNTWELQLFKRLDLSEETAIAVFTETTTVGNVTTGEDVLFTDTLAANTLSTNGNLVGGKFSGIFALNDNDKTLKLKINGTTVVTRLAINTPTVGQGWVVDWQLIRVDETNQKFNATFSGIDGIANAYYIALTEDLTEDVIITLTGEATATNDIIKHTASGNFAPGAGGGTEPPPIDPPDIPFVIVDDNTLGDQGYQFNYVSTWAAPCTGCDGWHNETLHYTGTTNAYVEVKFNGTRVQVYTEKKDTHGIFEVSLDGTVVDSVDLYSATGLLQQLVFDSGDADDPDNEEDLTQAEHTIKLRCTGTKNASSSNVYLIVDYIKVENPEDVVETPDPPGTGSKFVATTGSNGGANNCETSGTPCQTIAYALTQSTSGDVISVAAGTYTETSYLVVPTGISIDGAGIDQTIVKVTAGLNFDGTVNASKCIFQYTANGSTEQTLSDLTVDGNAKAVHGGVFIATNRNNVTLRRVKVQNFDYFGVYVGGNDHELYDTQIINSAESAGFSTGALMIDATDNFLCDNVDISESEGYGVKAWGGQPIISDFIFRNGEVRVPAGSACCGGSNIAFELHNCKPRNSLIENTYFDNSLSLVRPTGFADDGFPTVHIKNCTFDMITKGGGTAVQAPLELGMHNMEVSYNHVVGGKYAMIVHWESNAAYYAVDWDIHHNSFYFVGSINSPTAVIRTAAAPMNDIDFFNNTIHIPPGSNYHTNIVQSSSNSTSVDVNITNNVIYDESTADTGSGGASTITRAQGAGGWSGCVFSYNSVIGMSTSMPAGWTVSNTLGTGPNFQGGGGVNPSPFVYDPFYRPAAGSPLINSGVDVGLPYTGAAPDRGRLGD